MKEKSKYWLAFSKLDGVGSANLLDIYNYFHSMKSAWIASAMDWQSVKQLRNSTITSSEKSEDIDLSEDEKQFYDIISYELVNVEKIASKVKININNLMIVLTMLELKGIIKQLPGEIYMKV